MRRRGPSLDERLVALAEAADLAEGRADPEAVAAARAVVARAGARLGLGVEATVAALAGTTGAGKSTLFNALAGRELVASSRRRPTTATATAATWGPVPEPLLDWLAVPARHPLGAGDDEGLVLLDLPDFDSVERAHHAEVDRLVAVVDLLVWVADPEKYADASLHERYLRPLAAHREQTLVVLNQADRLDAAAREQVRRDLTGLLARDGLDGVDVLAVSARTGEGVDALRAALRDRAARREAAAARLAVDAAQAGGALGAGCEGRAAGAGDTDRRRLVAALESAAGAPVVVAAVGRSHRRQGALATGWPLVRWARRLRPDPLRRLRVGDEATRTSLPAPTPVQRAGVSSACRALATAAAGDLPAPWPGLVRGAATAREDALPDRLDRAVGGAELPTGRPRWWVLAGLLQRAAALVALAGLLWLLVLAGLGLLQLGDVLPLPEVEGIALPTLLLTAGVLVGLLLSVLFGFVNRGSARRRARRAERALRARVEAVAEEEVLAPVRAELAARDALCAAVARATSRAS